MAPAPGWIANLWSIPNFFEGQGELVCLKRTQLPRVTYTFYSQVNPTYSWCPPGNANWGYSNLVSMCHQKKISTSLMVMILVRYKWHMWTVQLRDSVSGKNTQFPGLPTGLHQEGHPAVKLSAPIKSCKMSNNVMSYNGTISSRNGVIPGREKVKCGSIQTIIQCHIKYVEDVNYVYPHGM